MLDDDAGVELAVVADEELSDPELDFVPLSPEVEAEGESLLPSLELVELSPELPFDPLSDDRAAPVGFAL